LSGFALGFILEGFSANCAVPGGARHPRARWQQSCPSIGRRAAAVPERP
jgi:hypothetical protein